MRGHRRSVRPSLARVLAVCAVVLALSASAVSALGGRERSGPPSQILGVSAPPRGGPSAPDHPALPVGASPLPGAGLPPYRLTALARPSTACGVGYVNQPEWLAYDSINNSFWVATGSSCVDRIDLSSTGSGFSVGATVAVGRDPFGVAVDNLSNEVFVTNNGSANVTVVSAVNNSVVGNLPVGTDPRGIAFDWVTQEVFVGNELSNNVSVFDATTLKSLGSVAVGAVPFGVTADPADGLVFVENYGSANVSVISERTLTVVASVPTGTGPYASTWDPVSDTIYTTNAGSGNVSVINASSATVTASIPVAGPGFGTLEGLAFDSVNGTLWVSGGIGWVAVVNASTNSVVGYASDDPAGVAYDPLNNTICVTNTNNRTFDCFVVGVGYPTPGPGSVATLVFNESGLPNGTGWSAGLSVENEGSAGGTSVSHRLVFGQDSLEDCWGSGFGVANYTIPNDGGFVPTPSAGTLNLCGVAKVQVNVTFRPANGTYPVYLNESGLAFGATWSVTVGTAATFGEAGPLEVWLPNGTYPVAVGPAGLFDPNPRSTNLTVAGAGTNLTVAFTTPGANEFQVAFWPTGLAARTLWSVTIAGPAGSRAWAGSVTNHSFMLPNGTYSYHASAAGYVPVPWNGTVVVQGALQAVFPNFTRAPYSVVFREAGLLFGGPFRVAIVGQDSEQGIDAITFLEPNGTFSYLVAPVGDLYARPSAGNFTVAGAEVALNLTFGPYAYPVTFVEQGLPANTPWSVDLNGSWHSSDANSFVVFLPNGSFPYDVGAVFGFHARTNLSFSVNGAAVRVVIGFSPYLFALQFSETGLPSGTGWGVLLGSEVASGRTSNLSFLEPNGTYTYVLLAVPGYVSTGSGVAVVNGSAAVVALSFHEQTYPVVFVELGLPAGANWSVTVADPATGYRAAQSSTTNAITFFLPNGTYNVSFTLPAGSTANASATQITVDGRPPQSTTIAVGHPVAPTRPAATAPPSPPWGWVSVVVVVGLAAGVAGAWLGGRRLPRRPPPPGPVAPPST